MPKSILFWPDVYKEQGHWLPTLKWAEDFSNNNLLRISKMTTQIRPSCPSRFSAFKAIILCLLAGATCMSFVGCGGDTESSTSPVDEITSSTSNEVVESSDGSALLLTSSSESESSSSEKAVDGSSSSDGKASSSSGKVESSSSGKGEKSSSSEGAAGSSSSDVVAGSSSSEKSSSSVAESSSSVESSSSKEPSSSSVVESSSSVAESISSSEDNVSSSSEYYKSSWTYLNKNITYDTIIDSRDNQVYKILTIGEQTWMAENLNYYDTIQMPELKQHSWCFADKESNCELYGRLYDLPITLDYDPHETDLFDLYYEEQLKDTSDIQGICPDGWRIPTHSEFKILIKNFSYKQLVSQGESGFSVIQFTGYWNDYNKKYINKESDFWTTSYSSGTSALIMHFTQTEVLPDYGYSYANGVSVRCLKDSE